MSERFETALAAFEQAYGALISIAETCPVSLQTQPGTDGERSAWEVLAHLAGWLAEAKRRYPRYALGTGDIHYNVEVFNSVSVRMRRELSYQQILNETRSSYCELLELARNLPQAYIARDPRYAEWLTNLARDAAHSQQLMIFVQESSR